MQLLKSLMRATCFVCVAWLAARLVQTELTVDTFTVVLSGIIGFSASAGWYE